MKSLQVAYSAKPIWRVFSLAYDPEERLKYLESYFRDLSTQKMKDWVLLCVYAAQYPPVGWTLGDYPKEVVDKAWSIIIESLKARSIDEEAFIVYKKISSLPNSQKVAQILSAQLDILIVGEECITEEEDLVH